MLYAFSIHLKKLLISGALSHREYAKFEAFDGIVLCFELLFTGIAEGISNQAASRS